MVDAARERAQLGNPTGFLMRWSPFVDAARERAQLGNVVSTVNCVLGFSGCGARTRAAWELGSSIFMSGKNWWMRRANARSLGTCSEHLDFVYLVWMRRANARSLGTC